MISSVKINNKFIKMEEIIYSYLEKGKDGLGRDIRYIKEEQLPNLLKKLEKAINYTRCSTQLKDKEIPTFEEWLKDKFIKISDTDYTNKDQDCIWGYYELEDIYKLMN